MNDHLRNLPAKLAAHHLFATAGPDPLGWAMLRHAGVDLDHVTNVNGPIVRSLVTFQNGRFEFDDAYGEISFVNCVHGEDAETVIDLVAWAARDPEIFGSMFGAGVLGLDVLMNPASYVTAPCKLFHTPLAWLQAKCAGAAILELNAAKGDLQRALGPVTTESLDHAESLLRSGVVRVDKIHVPATWGRAA